MTNRERLSARTSSLRIGRCAMSTVIFLPTGDRYMTPRESAGARPRRWPPHRSAGATLGGTDSVLGVELDDQVLGERRVDLLAGRELVDQHLQAARDDVQPRRDGALAEGLAGQLEGEGLHRLLADRDDVVLLDALAGDVGPLAVDLQVAVGDQLAGLPAGAGQAGAVDDVVQAGLEDGQQVVTGLAGTVRRLLVVPEELLLHDAVRS